MIRSRVETIVAFIIVSLSAPALVATGCNDSTGGAADGGAEDADAATDTTDTATDSGPSDVPLDARGTDGDDSGDTDGDDAGDTDGDDSGDTGSGGSKFATRWSDTLSSTRDVRDVARGVAVAPEGAVYVAGVTQGELGDSERFVERTPQPFVSKWSPDGTPQWTRLMEAPQRAFAGEVVFRNGSVYVAGRGPVSNDPSPEDDGTFVARYRPDGTQRWVRSFATDNPNAPLMGFLGLAVDASGTVYVAGSTTKSLSETDPYQGGQFDAFAAALADDGTRTWTRLLGTSGTDSIGDVAIGPDGEVFAVGSTTVGLDSSKNSGLFVAQLGAEDGSTRTLHHMADSGREAGMSLAVDSGGDLFVTGSVDQSLGEENYSGGPTDAFVAKYDTDFNREWVRLSGTDSQTLADTGAHLALAGASEQFVVVQGQLGGVLIRCREAASGNSDACSIDVSEEERPVEDMASGGPDRSELGFAVLKTELAGPDTQVQNVGVLKKQLE